MRIRFLTVIFLALLSGTALALDASDAGTYAVVHRKGHTTDKVFRVAHSEGRWRVEDRMPDGTWKDVTCQGDCILRESSPSDLARFFSPIDLKLISPDCVHNSAFAFCSFVGYPNAAARSHVIVALVRAEPIHIRLVRISH